MSSYSKNILDLIVKCLRDFNLEMLHYCVFSSKKRKPRSQNWRWLCFLDKGTNLFEVGKMQGVIVC